MIIRRYHRLVGIIMLTPLLAWTLTGLLFLIQPGYGAAYEMLQPRTYPLSGTLNSLVVLPADSGWGDFRYLRTVLGDHLLVSGEEGWEHLRAETLELWPQPDAQMQLQLVADAVALKPERYGQVLRHEEGAMVTSTGVRITLDWNTLGLRQSGNDTRWIDQLYQLHYLQWTGVRWLDRILGVAGLFLLAVMTVTGFRLSFRGRLTATPD